MSLEPDHLKGLAQAEDGSTQAVTATARADRAGANGLERVKGDDNGTKDSFKRGKQAMCNTWLAGGTWKPRLCNLYATPVQPQSATIAPGFSSPFMPRFLYRYALLLLAGLTAAGVGVFLVTLASLFAAEDYGVQPGSPAYYVGISSVIRRLELPHGAQAREYRGSVGDGNKAPQSQLGFDAAHHLAAQAWDAMDGQLRGLGFHPSGTHQRTAFPVTREQEYLSTQDDLIVVSTQVDPDDSVQGPVRFFITHFD